VGDGREREREDVGRESCINMGDRTLDQESGS
jgi:hypothetical protein